MTRRLFLRRGTAAAVGTWLLPHRVKSESLEPIRIPDLTIKSITYARHEIRHPRYIGRNSFKDHPRSLPMRIVRVQTDGGVEGIGDHLDKRAIGKNLADLLVVNKGTVDLHPKATFLGTSQQAVLLDILGKALRRPAYRLLGPARRSQVDVYDGTIYMRDLDSGESELARNIEDGMQAGHRAFKLKVGRGRWTTRKTGLKKDRDAVLLARRIAGPAAHILIDANNYYTVDEAVELLDKVGDQKIFIAEELFSESEAGAYRRVADFLGARRYKTLLADGEGTHGGGELMSRIEDGTVQVAQPDIRDIGLLQYRAYARKVAGFRAQVAPHTWAKLIGVAESIYLAAVTDNFLIAEDCRLHSDVVSITGYEIKEGKAILKNVPGMGLAIDQQAWDAQCAPKAETIS